MERELSNKALAGDAMGQFALNIGTGLLGMITYYYTDIVGVSAGIVGTIMLMTKAIDAFADVGMGVLVDRTRSKHGQARPWLLWMMVPLFASILLLFSVPDIGRDAKIAYAVATNILFFVFVYTPLSIPYVSLMALTTRNPADRGLMGAFRAGAGYLAGMVVAIGFVPIVNAMGGGRLEWTMLAAIFGAIAAAGVYVAFRSTKEKYNTQQLKDSGDVKKTLTLFSSFKLLFTNRYWLIIFSAGLLSQILFGLSATSGMYYAKYVWGDVNLVSLMGGIGLIPVAIVFLASGPLMKRIGKRNTAVLGLAIGTLGILLRMMDPESISLGLVGSLVQAFGMIPLMIVLQPLNADTIEYGEWKHGQRIVGLTNSVNSFGGKIGAALGTAIIGWMLAWGHYVEGASEQSAAAKQMIITFNLHIPLAIYIVVAILLCFFSLEKQYTRILDDLEQRKGTFGM
ncbi:MFS transporter [Cohnella thailandensis]|uniref:MFS transporter n=1 Tax=Cohnella thailandensis TaxID=557557 RepID=A0A841SRR0_9BACL|nr:glycoside-pentoside-hexuronide (GPH):cation symporter [Cohnella thailandensis]MBB6634624.1 MFS transporter [Cohnella thailandensis]MBP1972820.1 GPH family glycoside/pentoside/hexuronide:cation symporter [Cohnella thailandensis]